MSKLNKRQQRELAELEQLRSQENEVGKEESEEEAEEEHEEEEEGIANPFAALNAKEEEEDAESDEEEVITAPKKSKKKKSKKKKTGGIAPEDIEESPAPAQAIATPKTGKKKKKGKVDPLDEMDEVDRALAELKLKYGEEKDVSSAAESSKMAESFEASTSFLDIRNLLSVDPKNLDADAELRRFFGSKVIASSTPTTKGRAAPSAKLRSVLAKPKPNWPPATSLSGLVMREMTDDETSALYERRTTPLEGDGGEKWFTFEHSGAWREVERQFLGATRSHDPNELMALLSVYPWHVDTLLQMCEVYRLQSDIGAASEYAERALYAFDRCLIPSFNVQSGTTRLDFDRVENRAMFLAVHRIIAYLARRGCWVTAFNFAKLLFALDPEGDPHAAGLWLDFMAIKSGNIAWLKSIMNLDMAAVSTGIMQLQALPGMVYNHALGLRIEEEKNKTKDHIESDKALRAAMIRYPQVVVLLADKIGASVPSELRSNPLFEVQGGYIESEDNLAHLLSHIYVARSEALWKEPPLIKWFGSIATSLLPTVDSSENLALRTHSLGLLLIPKDPVDGSLNTPLSICRHVFCSESTSWLGFLPPAISRKPFLSYDPLPPSNAVSSYDADYFNGVQSRRQPRGGAAQSEGIAGWLGRLREVVNGGGGDGDRENGVREIYEQLFGGANQEERELIMQQIMEGMNAEQDRGMPGGFPAEHEE
ncbi:transcription factor 25, partial [Tremellales sp. Uapishka_1]